MTMLTIMLFADTSTCMWNFRCMLTAACTWKCTCHVLTIDLVSQPST